MKVQIFWSLVAQSILNLFQGEKQPEHHSSKESLNVGNYGKCPEFVVVDGLIVSRQSREWGEEHR